MISKEIENYRLQCQFYDICDDPSRSPKFCNQNRRYYRYEMRDYCETNVKRINEKNKEWILDHILEQMEKEGMIKITAHKNDNGEEDKLIKLNEEYLIFDEHRPSIYQKLKYEKF